MEPAALDRATKKRMSEITTWVAYTRVTWEQAQLLTDVAKEEGKAPIERIMDTFARLRFMEARALIAARKDCEETVKAEIAAADPGTPPEATGAPATSEGYVDRSEGVPAKSVAV